MGPTWQSFRIDAASLYLREQDPGTCTAEIKMVFAGFGQPFMGALAWYAVDSNFAFESDLLSQIEKQSERAASADVKKAVSQLPAAPPDRSDEAAARARLTITSEPVGAEIEINGEYIGSTPTSVSVAEGQAVIAIKKAGFQSWQRTLNLSIGDERTIHAEMVEQDLGIAQGALNVHREFEEQAP